MVLACLVILALQLAGEVVSRGLGLPVPGPVLGMAALLVGFWLAPGLVALVRPVGQSLLANLSLMFVPAGVGIVAHLPLLRDEGPALVLALATSTAAAIGVGALVFVAVARLTGSPATSAGEAHDES
ncbi:CidA/LrgA family protein [Paracoccus suum]|uniref:CidA/LrgA family protein n=1 Tax=Paracoccus suum TaxID=2259340 RepID=A0A344PPN7_9RHOB|nr:CidA/LrgA family protein [Paracoccus suum]AXC51342.1 CidA/LrgA family protein [Paracoccus suum]